MKTRNVLRRALSAALGLQLVIGAFAVGTASAGTFQVNPIRITFSPKVTTALLSVRNDSKEKTRFQISAFVRDQKPDGEMVLAPTEDIVFYPSLLVIDGESERNIRIGTNHSAAEAERSYRIFVEELPPLEKSEAAGIRILTKMGVPIFVQPPQPTSRGALEDVALVDGKLLFRIRNRGNVHFFPRAIRVVGTGAQGESWSAPRIPPWYILAGGSREYRLELPRTECARLHKLVVEVELEKPEFAMLSLAQGACGH